MDHRPRVTQEAASINEIPILGSTSIARSTSHPAPAHEASLQTDKMRVDLDPFNLGAKHQHYTIESNDIRSLLITFRKRFYPTERERERGLQMRVDWHAHARSTSKDTGNDSWLKKWESLYIEAIGAEVPDVVKFDTAIYDFSSAIRPQYEIFYHMWYDRVYRTDEVISINDILSAYRQHRVSYRKRSPRQPTIGLAILANRPQKHAVPAKSNDRLQPANLHMWRQALLAIMSKSSQSCPYRRMEAEQPDREEDQ
ncbi:hypothetical protein N7490_006223 [Penicillium lividum]|nr:hypothetical protein N7490_006223 [Penicillium lividum]